MPYCLAEHVSCCEIEDRTVFLDVARDRYFLLPLELDAAFRTVRSGGRPPEKQLLGLISAGILVESHEMDEASNHSIQRPSRSALEPVAPYSRIRPGPATAMEVLATVCWMRWRLQSQHLQSILANTGMRANDEELPTKARSHAQDRLAAAAAQFTLARRYAPVERTCLLDSLSLARFLARRRLAAAIVFGVTLHPFAAHCWVQAGDLVLNETLSDANAYTPIRVIR
ncbi:lasso peptide biosynthesis B2 protein [Luteimonas sp. R10]|uniref:lasso peptide biosynthesis B2 protein n=1 Tax=Luteimonas sp. R10 TaxID=3108176 RepID=UPI003090E7E1|nr:lasso peptide biosynthesis B2 protein [Luteimonas sp. R10]